MIFITGDTHGDFIRFSTNIFPEQKEMSKDDQVVGSIPITNSMQKVQ